MTFHFRQVLNIGLKNPAGGSVNETTLEKTLKLFNPEHSGMVIHRTGMFHRGEPTFVVFLETPMTTDTVYTLCDLFDQACIARWYVSMQAGDLVGPMAHEWGEFDKSLFLGAI